MKCNVTTFLKSFVTIHQTTLVTHLDLVQGMVVIQDTAQGIAQDLVDQDPDKEFVKQDMLIVVTVFQDTFKKLILVKNQWKSHTKYLTTM